MAEIIWTRSAFKDLRDIHQFISSDSVFYADHLITVLYDRVNILERYPKAGRMVPEKEDVTIRELIEGNYRIFYKIFSNELIAILRIHHSSKKIK